MTKTAQRAFSGGILSPGMYARRDIPKWMTGFKDAENVVLRSQGGVDNRAGTKLASGYDTSTVDGHQYLIPFEASEDDTYMLEFGDAVMRVIKNGAYVLSTAFAGQSVTSITAANPAQIELVDAGAAANFTVGRLVYLTDPNGSSALHGAILEVTAIASEFITFKIVGGVTIDTTTGSWGAIGAGALLYEVYQIASPYAIEDMPLVQFEQDVDTMIFAHDGYQPQKLTRTSDASWAFSSLTFAPEIGQVTDVTSSISGATRANPCVITTSAAHGLTTGDAVGISGVVGMTQLNGNEYKVTVLTATTFSLQTLAGVNVDSTAYTAYTSGGTVSTLGAGAKVGSGSTTYKYKVAAVDSETGEEGLPSAEVSTTNDLSTAGNINTFFWPAVSGAAYYRVYKDYNGIFGYIGITEARTFEDENITPNTAENPQTGRDPFSGASDKPAVVAFVDSRLTFAATINNPQAVDMSTSTTPFNFNRALTPGASDAITFRMRSQKLNRVHHIVDADRPIILTSGAEWYMQTQEDAPISPGNFALRPKTYRGSARTPRPVIVGETLLHVSRDGNTLREFSLDLGRDTASADLTILARHLFEGKTIKSMAYAQSPDSVIWVVLTDGSLYSLTYLPEHEVWGWTRHAIGGTDVLVKQVAVVTEGAFDVPYFVVQRTLAGGTVTLVERLDTRQFTSVTDAYFVDCGLPYNGAATSTLRGYLHLRGESVAVLADGNVLENITVSAYGGVDLGASYSTVAVGLAYEAFLITLDADFGDQIAELGSSIGTYVSAHEVAVKVVNTRGIAVGREGGFLNEVKEFTGVSPIPLATKTHVVEIEGDWGRDLAVEVYQAYPLPMTITAIAPDWTIGG